MPNYSVALEAAWIVRDVENSDDAIGVAVSEAGKRLNRADLEYVEVNVGTTSCPACGEPLDASFLAAGTAMVGLLLEMEVFGVDDEAHAAGVAKSEIGDALRDIPIEVIDTVELEDEEG